MIFFGFAIKQFYAAKGMYGAVSSDRKVARWKGRLLFVADAWGVFSSDSSIFVDVYK